MRHLFFLPFWASLLLIGCAAPTAQPLLKKSPHDAAVHRTVTRLEGKKKKAKHVRHLEAAFRLAQQADLLAADSLLGLSTPDRWLYIHALYRRIQSRQAEIGPLLPLRADDGYTPDLLLVGDIAGRESASRQQAAAYLYGHANDLLATSAQTGRKQPAQQAYYTLRNLKDNYYRYRENTNTLIDSAYRAGQVYVLVQSDGHDVWGQGSLWQPIRTQAFAGYDTEWTHFYHDPASREQYDYRVLAHLASMVVGPEMRSESSRTETKQIEVGHKEVRDTSGVVVDRIPIYETVSATVTEIRVSKSASATLFMQIVEERTGALIHSQHFFDSADFEETAVHVSGDERALTCRPFTHIGTPMAPSDWAMMDDMTGDLLRQMFRASAYLLDQR